MDRPLLAALIVAVGAIAGGFFVGDGFARGRRADRFVEVKGLAEREVTATLALWPLRFAASGDDLAAAQAQITRGQKEVVAFLERNGIPAAAAELQNLQVTDANTMRYGREQPGGIRHSARDQAPGVNEGSQLHKTVRVVSTVQYLLE